jgi:phosphopantothenoylcysteine decarboxylase/phosphopantothenate--cysteine ligase
VALISSEANVFFAGPVTGKVASGDVGSGRMAEPEQVLEVLQQSLAPQDLSGRHIVISAGPTREAIDPVRFLSNRSSGKTGFALASRAAKRGARVTLVSGPVDLATPAGVQRIDVQTALQMESALASVLGPDLLGADALVMAAAVADYRSAGPSHEKLKRGAEPLALQLVPNPDILAGIGQKRMSKTPLLIGFALETAEGPRLIQLGRQKLIKKRVDLMVANSSEALEGDDTSAMLVGVRDCTDLKALKKEVLADHILKWVVEKLQQLEFDEATE